MNARLSVLVTYYDEKELLTECLRSLTSGSARPDEILVYDDASSFPAADYVPPGVSARVIRGERNRGPSFGRNVLLEAASGDYVHFHDTDDYFNDGWCKRVREEIARDPDVVYTEISSVRGEERCEKVMGLDQLKPDMDLARFCIRGSMLTPACTYRRSAALASGGYPEGLWQSEDYYFNVKFALTRPRFAVVEEPLVTIHVRRESRSQKIEEILPSTIQAIRMLATEAPEYRKDLANRAWYYGTIFFRNGYLEGARDAFNLAHSLGPLKYEGRSAAYCLIAATFGPVVAEYAAACSRILPRGEKERERH